jgi:hypothetical protein
MATMRNGLGLGPAHAAGTTSVCQQQFKSKKEDGKEAEVKEHIQQQEEEEEDWMIGLGMSMPPVLALLEETGRLEDLVCRTLAGSDQTHDQSLAVPFPSQTLSVNSTSSSCSMSDRNNSNRWSAGSGISLDVAATTEDDDDAAANHQDDQDLEAEVDDVAHREALLEKEQELSHIESLSQMVSKCVSE